MNKINWSTPTLPKGFSSESFTAASIARVEREADEILHRFGLAAPKKNRPKPTSRFNLMDVSDIAKSKPIGWRIKGVIPDSGIAAIYGPSGSAKTFLALDMALSLSKGLRWFGMRTKACPVVYVCLEGESGLSNRVSAYLTRNDVAGEVYFLTQPVSLLNEKDAPELAKAIIESEAAGGVVIIDTLNRAAPGMDENASGDMGKVIAMVKGLQCALGGLVLLVHHTGKDATKGMRGHSSLLAALDAAVEVTRNGDQRSWQVAKSKDGEDGTAHPFKLEVVQLGIDDDGDPVTSCVIKADSSNPIKKPLTPSMKLGMDTFHAAATNGVDSSDPRLQAHVDDWRHAFYQATTADTPDGKKRAFQRVRAQLVEQGQLIVHQDIYSVPVGFNPLAGHGT